MYMTGSVRHETEKVHIFALSLCLILELIVCAYTHHLSLLYIFTERYNYKNLFNNIILISHCPAHGVKSLWQTGVMTTRAVPKSCS